MSRLNRGLGSGDDDLLGGVQVGHPDLRELLQVVLQLIQLAHDRHHGAGFKIRIVRSLHGLPAGKGQSAVVRLGDHPGGPERGQFTEAVAGSEVRLKSCLSQDLEQPGADTSDSRLCMLCELQLGLLSLLRGLVERGRRKGDAGELLLSGIAEETVQLSIHLQRLGKAGEQLAPHVQVLRPLSREERHDLPGGVHSGGTIADALDAPGLGIALLLQGLQRGLQALLSLLFGGCNPTQPSLGGAQGLPGGLDQFPKGAWAFLSRECLKGCGGFGLQGFRRIGCQQEALRCLVEPVGAGVPPLMFFENKVKVGSAEAEGADAGTTRGAIRNPRARLGVEVQWGGLCLQLRVGLLQIDDWRQDLVVESKRNLDQPCCPGGGLGVSDLRFHASHRDRLQGGLGFAVNSLQPLKFGRISSLGARAVSLHQRDSGCGNLSVFVGPSQALGLSGSPRCVDALEASVAGGAHSLDDRIYPVSIALRIGETLQNDHAEPLSDHDAFGVFIKGLNAIFGGESRRFAEAHVHERRVVRIHASGDHQVCALLHQVAHGHLDGGQRASAGGIHSAVGPAQVEAVGDSAGDHVPKESRKRSLHPWNVGSLELLHHLVRVRIAQPTASEDFLPDRILQPRGQRAKQLHPGSHAQDHSGSIPDLFRSLGVSGVLQRVFGDEESEQLRGVGLLQQIGRNAELHRVEVHLREKASTPAVRLVWGRFVRVEVVLNPPAILRDVHDGIDLAHDVIPVRFQVGGLRKEGRHAYDGDRSLAEAACGISHGMANWASESGPRSESGLEFIKNKSC